LKFNIKLLGIAKKVGNQIELRVHPVLIPEDKMIAKVDGVMNGISVVGDKVGETMFYGAGAGGDATAICSYCKYY
jgi:homoserine dehydrogenase